MKDLSKHTRRALKLFDRHTQARSFFVTISTPDDDWSCRHSRIEDTLKQCRTGTLGILHAFCPLFQLGAFVTFPASQGTATTGQIIQALRLALITRSEAQA